MEKLIFVLFLISVLIVSPYSQDTLQNKKSENDQIQTESDQTVFHSMSESDNEAQTEEVMSQTESDPSQSTENKDENSELDPYMSDLEVIKLILKSNNGLNWKIKDIATFNNDRVITLNLNNQNIGEEGISVLIPQIGKCTELRELTINDNDLVVLPASIFTLSKLIRLEIRNNSLISLPDGIENLKNIQLIDLRNNQLSELPRQIGTLKSLYTLQLWGNNFVDLPIEIGNLSGLRELFLKGNRLEKLPNSIIKLKVIYIDVLDNKLCNLKDPVHSWLKKFDKKYKSLQKCVGQKRFK